jgi:tetratricopeptide (TPR) repeat protein
MPNHTLKRIVFITLLISLIAMAEPPAIRAQEKWKQVKSQNFLIIGNAYDKDLKHAAIRLEQFREIFTTLFPQMKAVAPIPTNIVVFKNSESMKPFLPLRKGKLDEDVGGVFVSGEDVNYMTMSADRRGEDDAYRILFHEYMHFLINANYDRSEIPFWLNEGLAQYYETLRTEGDQQVRVGLASAYQLGLLRDYNVMPFERLFAATNQEVHAKGGHSRSIVYAQSWALIHYLMSTGKSEQFGEFLAKAKRGMDQKQAFQEAFKTDFDSMERELRRYVDKGSFQFLLITLPKKLTTEAELQVTPLSDVERDTYLGDLLAHMGRYADAEPYLTSALKRDPAFSRANTTMGFVKMQQRKIDEAFAFFEKAIASDGRSHLAYYSYAYLLGLENVDGGTFKPLDSETASKMRVALRKAIEINPQFGESYDLLALTALSGGGGLNVALAQMETALKLQPGNQRYRLRIAEIQARQNKLKEAEETALKILQTTENEALKVRSKALLAYIAERRRTA